MLVHVLYIVILFLNFAPYVLGNMSSSIRIQLEFDEQFQQLGHHKALYHIQLPVKCINEVIYSIVDDFSLNSVAPHGIILKYNGEFVLLPSQPIAVLRDNDLIWYIMLDFLI